MCMNIQDKVIYLSNSRGLTQQQISERGKSVTGETYDINAS